MALTNSQYAEVMRIYDDIQIANRNELENRVKEVFTKSPEYAILDKQIKDDIISISLGRISDSLEDKAVPHISAYRERVLELSAKKKKLLVSLGYPADYLETIYTCPDCQDTGYIGNEKCHCFRKYVTELFYSKSNAKNISKEQTFNNFSFSHYRDDYVDETIGLSPYKNMQNIVSICRKFVEEFDNTSDNLLLYGNTGLGKTYLSNCIANELIKSCHNVVCLSAIELFKAFSKSEFEKDALSSDAASEIIECDLLIIDDLGTELSNNFTNMTLFYCVNDRILKNKSTIISTNLSLNDMFNRYSEKIFSRIAQSYKALKLVGQDIRLKKQ